MRSLIDLIKQGEAIASGFSAGKQAGAVKGHYAAWKSQVEKHLKGEPLALARFRNAVPVLPQANVPFGVAPHWQSLRGELAVLIALEKERPEAVTLKPGWMGVSTDLKVTWRRLGAWLRGE